MTISSTHTFVSAKAQSSDATVVSKNEWNDEHVNTMATGKLVGRTTAGTGAFEEITPDSVDFSFTGAALAIGSGILRIESADSNLVDSGVQQQVFGANGVFTAAASTAYSIDAFFHIARTAGTTSHTTAIGFTGSVGVSSIRFLINVSNPTGNALSAVNSIVGTSNAVVVATAANTSATENLIFRITGCLRTTTTGNFAPVIEYSAAPGGVPVLKANSYLRLQKIGTNTFTNAGGWT